VEHSGGHDAGSPSLVVPLGIEGLEDAVEIGRGGFAVVYRARQTALNRLVAVKVLAASLDPSSRLRFAREGFAVGSLSGHPNIVTVFDTGMTPGGRPYIAMAYLPRGSLADRLDRDGPLPWPEATRVGVKLAGALETAHATGTLHRDVKPENVLISDYGEPQLADFGIARVEGRFETSTGHVLASFSYAAPEILDGHQATVASDVYSLAATVFALLAGCPPFLRGPAEELVALYLRIATAPVPDLRSRGVPDEVCRVLEAALAKPPARRPDSAADFGRLLQEAERQTGMPVTDMAVGRPAPVTDAGGPAAGPGRRGDGTHLEVRVGSGGSPGPADRSAVVDDVRAVLDDAARLLAGTPAARTVARWQARLAEPVQVAVAGRTGAGKSTLVNALVGDIVAPGDLDRDTPVPVWYRHAPTGYVSFVRRDGEAAGAAFSRHPDGITVDLPATGPGLQRLVVEWPAAALEAMTLVDTPAFASFGSVPPGHPWAEFALPAEDEEPPDAVVYLLGTPPGPDLWFLERFRRGDAPVNVVGVVAKADTLGPSGGDVLGAARVVAAEAAADPALRRVCPVVVAVSGLLAATGATLEVEEFRLLQLLAAAPPGEAERRLASAGAFTDAAAGLPLPAAERRRLLARFGLAGVRLAVESVRADPAPTPGRLAAALVEHSGVGELRRVVARHFVAPADALKARSALVAVEAACRAAAPPGTDRLLAHVERVWAGAHDLAELALLASWRPEEAGLSAGEAAEAERLLGVEGTTPSARLGLPSDSGPSELRAAAVAAAERWQRRAAHPLAPPPMVEAAAVLIRSCEGIVARLAG
jgi:hypothetical protein